MLTRCYCIARFDCPLFIAELAKQRQLTDRIYHMDGLPASTERFRTLELNSMIFMDSLSFLSDSLAKLTETLKLSKHQFDILAQCEPNARRRELLTRKGVYPYSCLTSVGDLRAQKTLPDIDRFYNQLTSEQCDPLDHEHAKKVYEEFGCEDMVDYTMLYLQTDVYLLAESMNHFRNMVYDDFKLDICNYLSTPMLTKDLMLKQTGVKIELMADREMTHLIRSNIRGGVSYINTRLSKEREGFSICYLDANNLYGKAMTFPLPLRNFKWMSECELARVRDNWREMIHDRDGEGYFFEVTLRYPEKLHVSHNSFPLAAEHVLIDDDMLSPYAKSCLSQLSKSKTYSQKKLSATFNDREKYLVHGLNLKLYLEQGLELVKIHRGISFRQESFIKPYIDMCTARRAAAPTKSMKDLYKLLCNSLYGKFIENILKRLDAHFNASHRQCMIKSTNPLFQGFKIFNENVSVSFLKKAEVRMSQAWAIGFSILELSKYVMQNSYYNHVKPKLSDGVSVLMSDTDSWVLEARKDSCDELIRELGGDFMDCSNYDKNHKLFSEHNKSVVGKFKNEVPKTTIKRFAGIRAKSYAFDTADGEQWRKCKGIKKSQVRKLSFEDYERCLRDISSVRVEQRQLQCKNFQNHMMRCDKQAFSSFDDKRYLMCPIHSVPYGSKLIKEYNLTGQCYFCLNPSVLC